MRPLRRRKSALRKSKRPRRRRGDGGCMSTKFILPESVARQNGAGPVIALDEDHGKPLLLTLGITRAVEQESLEISLWGSPDKENWRVLATFPQKFYCGTYSLLLDLSRELDVDYL